MTGKAFNLTDHFNALGVHNNTSDPQFGTFLAHIRGDLDWISM
jgi:hypothetical protein